MSREVSVFHTRLSYCLTGYSIVFKDWRCWRYAALGGIVRRISLHLHVSRRTCAHILPSVITELGTSRSSVRLLVPSSRPGYLCISVSVQHRTLVFMYVPQRRHLGTVFMMLSCSARLDDFRCLDWRRKFVVGYGGPSMVWTGKFTLTIPCGAAHLSLRRVLSIALGRPAGTYDDDSDVEYREHSLAFSTLDTSAQFRHHDSR